MSIRGLVPQAVDIPLAAGLAQKMDPRALEPPGLTIASNIQFDKLGGIQPRYPFAAAAGDMYDASTLDDARRIVSNGGELLLFTKDRLLSWNAQLSMWVPKGTHLAVKVDESTMFATPGDQVDADRAECQGTIVYIWEEPSLYAAAVDATTGSVLVGPTAIASASGASRRGRVVACSTKILLFTEEYNGATYDIAVRSIDPAAPASSFAAAATTILAAASSGTYYDVTRHIGQDAAIGVIRRNPDTNYQAFRVDTSLTITSSNKARQCDGAVACSCDPTGATMTVVRYDIANTDIRADNITISGFVDGSVNIVLDSAPGIYPSRITCAHRDVLQSGVYRCHAFWDVNGDYVDTNWFDSAGTTGTKSTISLQLKLASRAFTRDGYTYFWGVFDGVSTSFSGGYSAQFGYSLQNTYFLYRDDATIHAKSTPTKSGSVPSVGWLGGVQLVDTETYAWCGTERRVFTTGGSDPSTGYGDRTPRDVIVTFDSNEARRCARLGETLYVTGGEVLQYDGARLVEVGFHVYPWTIALGATTGSVEDGTYAWKQTCRYTNAKGDVDRSTSATTGIGEVTGGPVGVTIQGINIFTTKKAAISLETWRTAKNPTLDAPFYLVSNPDPTSTANPNRYVANVTTTSLTSVLNDEMADATLIGKASLPDNGGLLEPISPPPATIIAATSDRLFLAGVAGDPDRVWYSRLRGEGEVASFHEALTFSVPKAGGAITGLAFLNETLVVFRETAIYALPGDGFDNTGGGNNYGPARLLSADVGAESAEAIALEPRGLVFHGRKGKYLLGRGWGVEYIGGPVSDYDAEPVLSVHVLEDRHQIRWLTGSRMMVLDYLANQWAEWTIGNGIHACIWSGTYRYLTASGPRTELSTYAGMDYVIDIETAWIPLGQIQGFGRVWGVLIFGEYRSGHTLRIRLARNYATTYFQDKTWTPSPTTVGGSLQVRHAPSIQEMQAIKIRITGDVDVFYPDGGGAPIESDAQESLRLTRLGLEVGLERGLMRLPAAQRQ